MKSNNALLGFILLAFLSLTACSDKDPLPSWNEGPSKQAIIQFVEEIAKPESPHFIREEERIATFDNDGTLWTSHPMYFQLFFAIDRLKVLEPNNPKWKGLFSGDPKALGDLGEKGIAEIIMTTHAGMSTEEFEQIVLDWLAAAKHPRFNRPFTDLVYQPMLELLDYLRANGFKTYIVSGGGIEFMRPFTEKVYGIPPEQVVGSSIKTEYVVKDGKPILMRLPKMNFIDDKAGKPVGINEFIGRRPIFAFGNSDGDLEMLEWTEAGKGKRFMGIVHHTDAVREYAYDKDTPFGKLDKGLTEAKEKGWLLVDMKNDWKVIYPFELQQKSEEVPQKTSR